MQPRHFCFSFHFVNVRNLLACEAYTTFIILKIKLLIHSMPNQRFTDVFKGYTKRFVVLTWLIQARLAGDWVQSALLICINHGQSQYNSCLHSFIVIVRCTVELTWKTFFFSLRNRSTSIFLFIIELGFIVLVFIKFIINRF